MSQVERAEAMRRLGMFVQCVECDDYVRTEDALRAEQVQPTQVRHLCSMHCLLLRSEGRTGTLRAYRWSSERGGWTFVGLYGKVPGFPGPGASAWMWQWTDTGDALWIEWNVARLRAAGEIS